MDRALWGGAFASFAWGWPRPVRARRAALSLTIGHGGCCPICIGQGAPPPLPTVVETVVFAHVRAMPGLRAMHYIFCTTQVNQGHTTAFAHGRANTSPCPTRASVDC